MLLLCYEPASGFVSVGYKEQIRAVSTLGWVGCGPYGGRSALIADVFLAPETMLGCHHCSIFDILND